MDRCYEDSYYIGCEHALDHELGIKPTTYSTWEDERDEDEYED